MGKPSFLQIIIKSDSIFIDNSFAFRILLPGGAVWFNQTNGYSGAGTQIYHIAKGMNDRGVYFPLFGTCLGFELLVFISNQNKEILTDCSSNKQTLPLNFAKGKPKTHYEISAELVNFFMHVNFAHQF